jgi:stearoyl-CoA desaturase (Delta-9 desaturase)
MFPQIPFHRVNWLVSSFLIGTLFLSITAVPLYLWFFGIDWFQIALFFARPLLRPHGWLMFKLKPLPPFDNVPDLKKDSLLVWQDRYIHLIAALVAFVLPASIGFMWGGWRAALGAFLIAGVLRVVVLQHCTFCINSLCHYIGAQPYSSKCSARDSWFLAILTFGEGYHNYHHEFQHDYRNGVKPWQIDPTKWIIWILSRVGLVSKLRRVPTEKIVLAELAEAQCRLEAMLANPGLTETTAAYIANAYYSLRETAQQWTQRRAGQLEVTREMLTSLRNEIRVATNALRLPGLRQRQPA